MALRLSHVAKRTFFSLRKKPLRLPTDSTFAISQTLFDEETWPGYNPESYYPAKPGEILANKYLLMAKIGWGPGSAVWLAQDINRYVLSAVNRTQVKQ